MQDTKYATLTQLSAGIGGVIGFGFIWFPLAMWLVGPRDPFSDWHGREAVRWQLMMTLYMVVAALLFLAVTALGSVSAAASNPSLAWMIVSAIVWIGGFLFLIALALLTMIMPFIAAIKARDGKNYVYPFVCSPRRKIAPSGQPVAA